ncbi:GPO family capsid scaffolding protein [Faucicola boevrei]|uniref:GPO family capsid scaffolding protein n=1 Tax=Faucicola boevrei TaxID=346665 RepID=UPI0003618230|nr:GPO family capsid scaffolding protein [Moraxella boevrei]
MADTNQDIQWAGERTIKRFRVAREGQTVDGRALTQQQIIDMAETYNPVEYTARINVEHMSGWGGLKSEQYPCLGDVIACDCVLESFRINGKDVKLMSLYATLSALPQLVEANKNGQKLFTSIEFYPKFADTGRAYLVGIAVTDTPASRGTQPLKFQKTQDTQTTASDFMEIHMSATTQNQTSEPQQPSESEKQTVSSDSSFLEKFTAIFSKKDGLTAEQETAILQGFSTLKGEIDAQNSKYDALSNQFNDLSKQYADLKSDFDKVTENLSKQTTETPLPPVGVGHQLTDY